MKKVLLIQPPVEDFYSTPARTYPLGLLYVAAGPKSAGCDVRVLDAMAGGRSRAIPLPARFQYLKEHYVPGDKSPYRLFGHYRHFGLGWDALRERIREQGPDVIGISSLFTAYHSCAVETARMAREACPKARIVMGGGHVSTVPEKPPFVDEVVKGEGEALFMDLLGLPSASARPFPARDLIDPGDYRLNGKRMAFILTSRGCPHHCAFCSVHGVSPVYRVREPGEVLEEMEWCLREQEIAHFDIEDDNFGFDRERAMAILRGVARKMGGRVSLSCMNGLCADVLDEEMLSRMKSAGFRELNLSVASVNPGPLGRPFGAGLFETSVRKAASMGFSITAYFILGLPDEDPEAMLKTMEFLYGLPVRIAPSLFYPVPGTAMHDLCVERGYVRAGDYDAFRMTAAPVETERFSRPELFTLFRLTRLLNLSKEAGGKEAVHGFLREKALFRCLKKGREKVGAEKVVERFLEIFGKALGQRQPFRASSLES